MNQALIKSINYLIIIMGSYILGGKVIVFASGASIGGLLRYLFIPLGFIVTAILLMDYINSHRFDFRLLSFELRKIRVSLPHLIILIISSIIGALFIINQAEFRIYSITDLSVIVIVSVGFFASIYLLLTKDNAYGLATFILTLSPLSYYEWTNRFWWYSGGPVGPIAISPSLIFLWLMFGFMLIRKGKVDEPIIFSPLFKYIVAWCFLLFVSCICSANATKSFQIWFMECISFPLFFLLVVNLVRSYRDKKVVFMSIAINGAMRAMIASYFYLRLQRTANLYSSTLYDEIFNVSYLSLIAAVTLPLLFILFYHDYLTRYLRSIFFLIFLPVLSVLIFSQVKSSIASFLLVFTFCYVAFEQKNKKYVLTVIAICLSVLGITYLLLFSRVLYRDMLNIHTYSYIVRLDMWASALHIIKDYPIFGIGLGMWDEVFPEYASGSWITGGRWWALNNPHNLFLNYGVSGGVLALAAFSTIIMDISKQLLRLITSKAKDYGLNLGLLVSFVVFVLVFTFAQGSISLPMKGLIEGGYSKIPPVLDIGALFWVIIGLIFVNTQDKRVAISG